MRRSVLLIIVSLFLFSNVLFAQKTDRANTNPPQSDPFRISIGKSFSATTTRKTLNNKPKKNNNTNQASISTDFQEAVKIIKRNHIDGSKTKYSELTNEAITSMLTTLDPHSNYFSPSEWSELMSDQRSEYFGIGASIANYKSNGNFDTYILATFPNSPAYKAGLRFGDKIVEVNNEPVRNKTSLYVRNVVRGRKGSVVRIKVLRANSNVTETVALRRNRVPQPSIPDAYILRRNIGYIDLSRGFNYTTDEELTVAIKELKKQGMKSLILDLRDNTGGILNQAVRVAEKFLPSGKTIVSQKGRYVIENRKWDSGNDNPELFPLVVLVNEESASASEIVAGALQDYDRALIVGEKTFGKGLVQSVLDLPNGAGLTLTTAKYYTPSGRSIQRNYSTGNLYDYYQHKKPSNDSTKKSQAKKTISGRKVYGGDGITPDRTVTTQRVTDKQYKFIDSVFLFSRELVSGKVKGLGKYNVSKQIVFGHRIRPNEFTISPEIFDAFKDYVKSSTKLKFTDKEVDKEFNFISERIRYNLVSAKYGNITAQQVLTENDPQIQKAVQNLPRAKQLSKFLIDNKFSKFYR